MTFLIFRGIKIVKIAHKRSVQVLYLFIFEMIRFPSANRTYIYSSEFAQT